LKGAEVRVMGMVEDRKNWAAGTAEHAKRMFKETSNPYYIILSLAATKIGDFKPHDWALDALLTGVVKAWVDEGDGKKLSLDDALGLRTRRGGAPVSQKASTASCEDGVFRLIKTIHTCFDISIPDACEIVYYSIDFQFATEMEEVMWRPWKWPEDIDKEEFVSIEEIEKAKSKKIIDRFSKTPKVFNKLSARDWWSITRGDRLGYSLEYLIDRYYRVGTTRAVPSGRTDEMTMIYFGGVFLLKIDHDCTFKIDFDEQHGAVCKTALKGKPLRKEFAEFFARCPA
jgi:hypothetical protein